MGHIEVKDLTITGQERDYILTGGVTLEEVLQGDCEGGTCDPGGNVKLMAPYEEFLNLSLYISLEEYINYGGDRQDLNDIKSTYEAMLLNNSSTSLSGILNNGKEITISSVTATDLYGESAVQAVLGNIYQWQSNPFDPGFFDPLYNPSSLMAQRQAAILSTLNFEAVTDANGLDEAAKTELQEHLFQLDFLAGTGGTVSYINQDDDGVIKIGIANDFESSIPDSLSSWLQAYCLETDCNGTGEPDLSLLPSDFQLSGLLKVTYEGKTEIISNFYSTNNDGLILAEAVSPATYNYQVNIQGDPVEIVSIAPGNTAAEAGATNGTFEITLSEPARPGGLTVNFNVSDSTATYSADYSLTAGTNITGVTATTFTIAAGETSATLNLVPIDDSEIETGGETVNFNLATGSYIVSSTDNTAAVTIADNDFSEIEVAESGTSIADAGSFDFGSTARGSDLVKTFTITNSGNADLTLGGATLTGTGYSLVGTFPTASIPAGGSTTFQIQLDASSTGTFNGNLSFDNNDADENPFDFALSGAVNEISSLLEGSIAIAGATVFWDANKNGIQDAGEPSTNSDQTGQFDFELSVGNYDANNNGILDPEEGQIVAIGGIDTAIGLPLETPLKATPEAKVVTMLTTLVADLTDKGLTVNQANQLTVAALSLPSGVDLNSLDAIAATNNNETGGLETLAATTKVQNAVTQIAKLISGAAPALDNNLIVQNVIEAFVSQIQTNANLNVTDSVQLAALIQQAATAAQQSDPSLDLQHIASLAADAAEVMAAANQEIDNIVSSSGLAPEELHCKIAQVQFVALGETSQDLQLAGANSKAIADVVAENTGAALEAQIQAALASNSFGSDNDDTLVGEECHQDTLSGLNGNDVLYGFGNNDLLRGNSGNDTLLGGTGKDTLSGGQDDDALFGDDGSDTLYGGIGSDLLDGGDAEDFLDGGNGSDTLSGGSGNDTLFGHEGNDIVNGDDGDDLVLGHSGDDSLTGGSGNDFFWGNEGNDTLLGGTENDTLSGGQDDDALFGNDGSDILKGGIGNDLLDGGDGEDLLEGHEGTDTLSGGSGNDSLYGYTENDVLNGDGGDDFVNGYSGDDSLSGGSGKDSLVGDQGNDTLLGGTGNDTLKGGKGEDWLFGGEGSDLLGGGDGLDVFVLQPGYGSDTIAYFANGSDRIALASGLTFADLTITGSNGNTLISNGSELLATLTGINVSSIDSNDFMVLP